MKNDPAVSSSDAIGPLATVAALDPSAFSTIQTNEAIPSGWTERAKKAWAFYQEEPLVKNCINSWKTFAVGDCIQFASNDDDLKQEASTLAQRVQLSTFVKDMILQLLVKGDAVGFKSTDPKGDLAELVCVNPVSVKVTYEDGKLVKAAQQAENNVGDGGVKLPVDQLLHLKWDAPTFSQRGNSMVLPAFESIELLRDYRRAERAIAKRWTTPLRLIKVGGSYGQKMVMPDQAMLEQTRDMINRMDLKSGLVVPFYVTCETHGTEGQVLNVEDKISDVKEDIMVALGLSRSMVTGDGPNFATASVSLQKMLVMIREIKGFAIRILDWVFADWIEANGYSGKSLQYLFNDLDPTDAVDYKKLLLELYDRKLISRSTLQTKMDLVPDIERDNREQEKRLDLFDERTTRPIIDLVVAGVLDISQAKAILGLDDGATTEAQATALDGLGTQASNKLCDDCAHFDADTNHCRIHRRETLFDSPACRFLSQKPDPAAGRER
ncbi:hypothetical protein SCOR_32965 [Sulfidibacter corallicola]|uniref:Phage portal protein n=1 Tax=Sulfidibacter corallicola TaxID=2818388 RepID=A0A8A4TJI1_SULCO|nr:phage portal protein [Sulfidibacter corallicola]QTD49647.1 hypothetical protein J3U87_29035 [Sulfidibacter corallicola]